jgi:hypothetical protein
MVLERREEIHSEIGSPWVNLAAGLDLGGLD